jgi:3-phosphoshikimate 1-carboxyvinyltransferase
VASIIEALEAVGATAEHDGDALVVTGATALHGGRVDSHGDHRIAMAAAVAGLAADGTTEIDGWEAVATSYPGFEHDLERLCGS